MDKQIANWKKSATGKLELFCKTHCGMAVPGSTCSALGRGWVRALRGTLIGSEAILARGRFDIDALRGNS